MNKKYGIAAVITGAIVVGILAFTYNHTNQTNSPVPTQQSNTTSLVTTQPNTTNPVPPSPPTTTGRHFYAGINETVSIKSNS